MRSLALVGVLVACGSEGIDPSARPDLPTVPSDQSICSFGNPTRQVMNARVSTVADVDGDGRPELLTATTELAVLSATPDGFIPRHAFPIGDTAEAVLAADLDGDGDVDIATASLDTDSVSVFLGRGDGTFEAPTRHGVGEDPHSLATADIDADGQTDLVVGDRHSQVMTGDELESTLTVLFGNDGTFARTTTLLTDYTPQAIAAADFDNDGRADVVAVSVWTHRACIHLSRETGFLPKQCIPAGDTPVDIAVADFDADGALDLAIASTGAFPDFAFTQIMRGHGDGTFADAVPYATHDLQSSIAAADFNGDGSIDLAVHDNWHGAASIALNAGDGTFGPWATYAGGFRGHGLVVATDTNADKLVDLVVTSFYGVHVLRSRGSGAFDAPRIEEAIEEPRNLAVGDLDADGHRDVVVVGPSKRALYYGTADGTFTRIDAQAFHERFAAVGDFSADQLPDLVTAGGRYSTSLGGEEGIGQRAFAPVRFGFGQAEITDLVMNDLDRDGVTDIVVANDRGIEIHDVNGIVFELNMLADSTLVPIGSATSVALGDLDDDGRLDIVATVPATGLAVMLAASSFEPSWLSLEGHPQRVALGTVDGDRTLDIVAVTTNDDTIAVFTGSGDGSFAPPVTSPLPASALSLAVGELTGDDLMDVTVVYPSSPNNHTFDVRIMRSLGNGYFVGNYPVVTGIRPSKVVIADLDGDHRNEIVVLAHGDGLDTGNVTFAFPTCRPTADAIQR